jgi:uncharacterized protein (DUF2336 family)
LGMHARAAGAVLVDAERVTANYLTPLLSEIGDRVDVTVRRAYGDWTSLSLQGWVAELDRHGIEPIQVFGRRHEPGATTVALALDAVDLLAGGHVHHFVLIGVDAAALPLVARLRAGGAQVTWAGSGDGGVVAAACDDVLPLGDLDLGDGPIPGYRGRHLGDASAQ